jgi:DNA-binding CsgD family transcriptional regulator
LQVARRAADGLSCRQIAAELAVSVNTVKFHLKNVYLALGVHGRAELVHALVLYKEDKELPERVIDKETGPG